jgi:hypothetical protein
MKRVLGFKFLGFLGDGFGLGTGGLCPILYINSLSPSVRPSVRPSVCLTQTAFRPVNGLCDADSATP